MQNSPPTIPNLPLSTPRPTPRRLAEAAQRLAHITGLEVRLNEPMSVHTSLGVGGPAAIYALVHAVEAVCATTRLANELHLPFLAIGRGTNLLVLDGGFPGIVLSFDRPFSQITVEGTRISAQTGATLAEVCEAAAQAGLSGLEFAAGVPGSIGGAVAMNAGTEKGQIADVIESVEIVNSNGNLRRCLAPSLEFAYRRSCLRESNCIAVLVTFKLAKGNPAAIHKAMFEAVESRCRKQPLSLGSCGSVFKRPPGDYAGRLLEQAGVKGLKVGGARFSTKHANFILNEGNATANDILQLIEIARQRVRERCGVTLEEEVCVVGEPRPFSSLTL
ncbi:MAG: UDP-N-acetylmuramate dehydrogenase [Candidatus Zipacnadales bacterium]